MSDQAADHVDDRTASSPGVMLPSGLDALATKYRLTLPEAEEVWKRHDAGEDEEAVVHDVIRNRILMQKVHKEDPAGPSYPGGE